MSQFVFPLSCREHILLTQRWQEKSRVIQFAYFSSDEVPDMLSLEIGATLQQHPKHPTKPKRTFLWTTGTKLLSVITAQGSQNTA